MSDVATAVGRARAAQAAWAATPIGRRLRVIAGVRRHLAADPEPLRRALAGTGGGRDHEALVGEILPLADACRFLERRAARLLAPRLLGARGRPAWMFGVSARISREPLGVVLVIGPGNYPLFLTAAPALQALAAGNAVLVKPAPGWAEPVRWLETVLAAAGLPDGVLRVLGEGVADARAAVDAGVDHVVLTGSAATGRAVLADLAPRLVPATLELSGNDAVFVLPGANVDRVADALVFGLRFNGGATCMAPRRVFVAGTEADGLVAALSARLPGLPPVSLAADVRERLGAMLAEAAAGGARVLPGPPEPGAPVRPTVVLDADPAWRLLREDVFAPVLSLVRVGSTEEALALDARCPYALAASVFGPDREARRFAERVRAGSVVIEDLIAPTADPRLPFGGRGESGYGVTRGDEGLLALTRPKTIVVRAGGFRPHYDPPDVDTTAAALAYLGAVHGSGLWARLRSAAALFSALSRRGRRRRSRD